eukprot:TRINITY_DN9176_c0_g2_i4.p3 TRINITY_DN9176_c0_g2~~TRINITY_DN9176_c0_g2_i4.p3  ORF type:complete len:100 (+),score=14.92 TRINITY_DN9176_c0_g2_i4:825-1124(+)
MTSVGLNIAAETAPEIKPAQSFPTPDNSLCPSLLKRNLIGSYNPTLPEEKVSSLIIEIEIPLYNPLSPSLLTILLALLTVDCVRIGDHAPSPLDQDKTC